MFSLILHFFVETLFFFVRCFTATTAVVVKRVLRYIGAPPVVPFSTQTCACGREIDRRSPETVSRPARVCMATAYMPLSGCNFLALCFGWGGFLGYVRMVFIVSCRECDADRSAEWTKTEVVG